MNPILIMGDSGSGKTTSMRNLDPKTTFYIDADKKGLSWRGWKKQYCKEHENYMRSSNAENIMKAMARIDSEKKEIKTIVVDTLNWIMIDDEMERRKEKGYDKWADLAYSIIGVISMAKNLREDLTVIFTAHTQTDRDDSGYMYTRMKTSGRKLDKICPESMFTTVLISRCKDAARQEYIFETQSNNSTAKSPMGLFDDVEIPNDTMVVLEKLKEY